MNRIDLDLLDLERIRVPNIMPSIYADNCFYGVFILTARSFAPIEDRIPSILSRLEQIPSFLESAKRNLEEPPEIFTKVAIEVAEGGAAFMDETAAFIADAEPGAASKVGEAGDIKSAYEREMDRARRFVIEKDLVKIPPDEVLRIVDTPVFERPIIPYAAYLPPGPFESVQERVR